MAGAGSEDGVKAPAYLGPIRKTDLRLPKQEGHAQG